MVIEKRLPVMAKRITKLAFNVDQLEKQIENITEETERSVMQSKINRLKEQLEKVGGEFDAAMARHKEVHQVSADNRALILGKDTTYVTNTELRKDLQST